MIPEIYGNEKLLALIRTMVQNHHLPHACLIHGEAGLGKKTIARYLAMAALCEQKDAPCGTCRSCRKMLQDIHPDLILVEHSGKKQGFSVETIRGVLRDAIVAPNDGARKVYLFTDCDQIDPRAQNTLLKLTEEPPPHVLLIFTAGHPNVFLTTMLSRMMPLAVTPVSEADCIRALREKGHSPEDAARAAEVCPGNIGRCQDWLASESFRKLTDQAGLLTAAIAGRQSYEILRLLHEYETDRAQAAALLRLLDLQLRDAIVMKYTHSHLTGCDRPSAERLSGQLTSTRAMQLHEAVQEASEALHANVSTKLVLAALGGRLMQS